MYPSHCAPTRRHSMLFSNDMCHCPTRILWTVCCSPLHPTRAFTSVSSRLFACFPRTVAGVNVPCRHHCRTCGAVACRDCVQFTVKLKPGVVTQFAQLIRPEPEAVQRLTRVAESSGGRPRVRILSEESTDGDSSPSAATHRRRSSLQR